MCVATCFKYTERVHPKRTRADLHMIVVCRECARPLTAHLTVNKGSVGSLRVLSCAPKTSPSVRKGLLCAMLGVFGSMRDVGCDQ